MSDVMEKWRAALGVTPDELASLLGVSRVTVWRWLSGGATPRDRYIVALERWQKGELLLVRHQDGRVTFEPGDTMRKWLEAGATVSPGKGFYGPPPEDPDAEDPVDRALNGIDDIEDPRHLIMVLRHLERRLGAEGLAPDVPTKAPASGPPSQEEVIAAVERSSDSDIRALAQVVADRLRKISPKVADELDEQLALAVASPPMDANTLQAAVDALPPRGQRDFVQLNILVPRKVRDRSHERAKALGMRQSDYLRAVVSVAIDSSNDDASPADEDDSG